MKFSEIMQYILGVFKELLTLLRISKENKVKEIEIKNQEDFKDREIKQQNVTIKDADEKLISEVILAKDEAEKQRKLDEIRKIISK
jgi:hypothetical protein